MVGDFGDGSEREVLCKRRHDNTLGMDARIGEPTQIFPFCTDWPQPKMASIGATFRSSWE